MARGRYEDVGGLDVAVKDPRGVQDVEGEEELGSVEPPLEMSDGRGADEISERFRVRIL